MNRLTLSLAAVIALPALAATPIDETIDADGSDRLEIRNISGSVTVSGTDGDSVRITGELSEDAERLEVRRDGNRIVVHVIMPDDNRRNRNGFEETILNITAPRGMSVEADTVSADIRVSAIEGEQDLNTVSGDIDTALYGAEIYAQTVSGDVRVNGSETPTRADISSVSGDLSLDAIPGEITAQTVSGDIEVDSPMLERGEMKSVSGDIDLIVTLAASGRLRATTTSGDVDLSMRGDNAGQYDLSTFSGRIDNCFGPQPERQQFGPPSSSLRFDEGAGSARIDANSMSGDIDLCRS